MLILHTRMTAAPGSKPVDPFAGWTVYAGAPIGTGALCFGTTRAGPPSRTHLEPTTGPIAYLGFSDYTVWGAVRPGVTCLTLFDEHGEFETISGSQLIALGVTGTSSIRPDTATCRRS